MNRITQEARKRQAVVKPAKRKGKSIANGKYGVSLSNVKRWCKQYYKERSHRPHSHPKRHTAEEEEHTLENSVKFLQTKSYQNICRGATENKCVRWAANLPSNCCMKNSPYPEERDAPVGPTFGTALSSYMGHIYLHRREKS